MTTHQTTEPWILTFTGKRFFPLAPREEDIDILDIAHSLSMQCRFTGHTTAFYSVAEHSFRISHLVEGQLVDSHLALWGLLHDAAEAYLSDMSTPLKHGTGMGVQYQMYEKKLLAAICQKFGLSTEEPEQVKAADLTLLVTEKRDLMTNNLSHPDWGIVATPLRDRIEPMSPYRAKLAFLDRFEQIKARG